MFVAPQRSCSGLQWSKTKWCVYLYSNCRKWPKVLQECDIITFGWFNCWRQHLLPDTVLYHTSRHVISQMEIDFVILVFCAVVWCCWCWLRSGWGKKTIQTYPYSNCTFHHQNSQRKQTNFTVPTNLIENFGQHNLLYVSLSAWKTGEKLCKNKHGENCIAQVVCWYFVRLCGAAGVGCEVSEGKKPSKPIHILTALFTTRVHKENKQILPYQPTSGKLWPT